MIPVVIQCVPERLLVVREFRPELERQGARVIVACDKDRQGPLAMHKKAQELLRSALEDSGEAWGAVVQDDVLIAPTALQCASAAMDRSEPDVLHLFVPPSRYFERAHAAGAALCEKRRLWLQAVAYRRAFLDRVAGASVDADADHDDVWLDRVAEKLGARVVTMLPGVAQHRLDLKSTLGHPPTLGQTERRSRLYDPDAEPGWYREGGYHGA